MAQKEIEVILMRQLASYLAQPIFVVDAHGALLYYNEPAERILGLRFEETGEMSTEQLALTFRPADEAGRPLPAQEVPVIAALYSRRPAHRTLTIQGLDGVGRRIEATGIPLIGQQGKLLGAFAIFWEVPEKRGGA